MLFEDKVTQFKKSDFKDFSKFIRRSFHEKYILGDRTFLEWQYGIDSNSKNFSMVVLKDRNILYGCIGNGAKTYSILGKKKKVDLHMNLFIDKKLRSLGVGTVLIHALMKEGTVALNIGYNPDISTIYKRLGDWKEMGHFYRYVLIVNKKRVDDLLTGQEGKIQSKKWEIKLPARASPKKLTFAYRKRFTSVFDTFWKDISLKYSITIERTSAYLNWRYANHPYFMYLMLVAKEGSRIVGFLIYRFERSSSFTIARIIDFVSYDEYEIDLLCQFRQDIIKAKADMADFMFTGDYHHQSLEEAGFFEAQGTPLSSFPILFNPISYTKPFINFMVFTKDKSIQGEKFHDPRNWYLTKGDGDQDRPNPH